MPTPAAAQFEAVLTEKFPGIRFGRRNCRKISGSSTWSQHSWDNARDIYPPAAIKYYPPGDPKYTPYKVYLDLVWDFIGKNLEALNVRGRGLWQVTNHYNHIHVDFWPQGYSVPPCANGNLLFRYPDGTIKPIAQLINKYEEDTDMNMVAFVNAAYDSGHPALRESDRPYWLAKAEANPRDPEFYDLFKAVLGPWNQPGLEYNAIVKLSPPE